MVNVFILYCFFYSVDIAGVAIVVNVFILPVLQFAGVSIAGVATVGVTSAGVAIAGVSITCVEMVIVVFLVWLLQVLLM